MRIGTTFIVLNIPVLALLHTVVIMGKFWYLSYKLLKFLRTGTTFSLVRIYQIFIEQIFMCKIL